MAIEVNLTKGYVAVIDDEDAHLAALKWTASVAKNGRVYAYRTVRDGEGKQRNMRLHREVLGLKPGDPLVDHMDGDGLNCRRANLRAVTQSENRRNIAGPYATGSSGFLGVYRHGKGFRARLSVNGETKSFGTYATREAAHAARLAAEAAIWGIQPRRAEAHASTRG